MSSTLFTNVYSHISTFPQLNSCGPTTGTAKTLSTDWVWPPAQHHHLANNNMQQLVYFQGEFWFCSSFSLMVFYYIWFYLDEILTVSSWKQWKHSPQTEFCHPLISLPCHHWEAIEGNEWEVGNTITLLLTLIPSGQWMDKVRNLALYICYSGFLSIELFYFIHSIPISEGLKLSPHTEVCPPAPEVSAVILVYSTFYYWNQNEPLFNCSKNSVVLLAVGRVWGVVMLFCWSGWDEHVFHEDSPPSFSWGWNLTGCHQAYCHCQM